MFRSRFFEAQDDAKRFLIGNRISNVGFTGFQANGDGKWQAIVKNHSSKPVDLNWLIGISDSEPLVSQQLKLQTGELRQIRGEFPTR